MANPHRGEVEIKLNDGESYPLKFDWDALGNLQQMTGMPITEMATKLGVVELQAAVSCGLKYLDPRMTPKRAAARMDPGKFLYYVETVGQALLLALGLEDEESNEEDEGDRPLLTIPKTGSD